MWENMMMKTSEVKGKMVLKLCNLQHCRFQLRSQSLNIITIGVVKILLKASLFSEHN